VKCDYENDCVFKKGIGDSVRRVRGDKKLKLRIVNKDKICQNYFK